MERDCERNDTGEGCLQQHSMLEDARLGSDPQSRRTDSHLAEYRQAVHGFDIVPRLACPMVDGDVDCGELTEQRASRRYDDRVVNAVGTSSNPCSEHTGAERIG